MRIVVGCDLEEFRRYYRKLAEDKEWQGPFGFTEESSASWESLLPRNPAAIAIWRKRGCKEAYLQKDGEHVFYLSLTRESPNKID